jgi:NDP-sugar pyrophosphorylase family protein
MLSAKVFDVFPHKTPISLETDVFPALAQLHQLRGQALNGYHIDIGTPESYAEFSRIRRQSERR